MKPYYEEKGIQIYHARCEDVIPYLRDVHLVATDPPYNGVLAAEWDNQWKDDAAFLGWMDGVLAQIEKVITDNATLYSFSSPRLAARLEMLVAGRFRVIGNAVWDKGSDRNGAAGSGIDIAALRTYWTANTERVVIAEKKNGERFAIAEAGYERECQSLVRRVFQIGPLCEELGVSRKQIGALIGATYKNAESAVAQASNWILGKNIPNSADFEILRSVLPIVGEYEELRREYEELRREYEDLRRPFFLTAAEQWGDVWQFGLERNRLHPAQKPLPLMRQIIRVSSRERHNPPRCEGFGP